MENIAEGDNDEFCVDRALFELRRGRAIGIFDGDDCMSVASVETLRTATLERFNQTGHALVLFLTNTRAKVLGLAPKDGTSPGLKLSHPIDLATLKALAGIGTSDIPTDLDSLLTESSSRAVTAGLRLAKNARLVPALIAVRLPPKSWDETALSVRIEHLHRHTQRFGRVLRRVSEARIPLAGHEDCQFILYRDDLVDEEHLAITIGEPAPQTPVPVRLHSACLTGDVFESLRCDCGAQLRGAVKRIATAGGGVLLYLAQEGRGIGLANKLRAYELQDGGLDTLDADRHLGFSTDERNYRAAAAMLRDLDTTQIQLLTNNPEKIQALHEEGIEVMNRLPLVTPSNPHNERYVRTKRERAGHLPDSKNTTYLDPYRTTNALLDVT